MEEQDGEKWPSFAARGKGGQDKQSELTKNVKHTTWKFIEKILNNE